MKVGPQALILTDLMLDLDIARAEYFTAAVL